MKVSIFGAGYVGLVQAAAFAEVGHDVVCVDIDAAKVAKLSGGQVTIFEPDLEAMIQRGLAAGTLAFTTDAARAIDHAPILFIAVGTPPRPDGSADLSHVVAAAEAIAARMTTRKIIVTKSTVPVGTSDTVREIIAHNASGVAFDIVSNPEFLREGSAVEDCMRPDRIICGEVRGPEALDMLQAMNTGHDGSMCTLHANNPREALTRMENMIGMASVNLPSKAVRTQIVGAVNLIVQVSRMRDGVRRVTHVTEIIGMEGEVITTQDLFSFDFQGESREGTLIGQYKSSGVRPHSTKRAAYFGLERALQQAMMT